MELPDEVTIPEVTIPEVKVPRNIAVPVVIGVIALGVGVGVGYVLGKIRNKRPYFEGPSDRAGDNRVDAGGEHSRKGDLGDSSIEIEEAQPELPFTDAVTVRETIIVVEEETEIQTLMRTSPEKGDNYRDDYWDYKEEAQNRGPNRPYVIHVDEFNSDEMDYPHETLTYYVGDDVLCDSKGAPVYNRDIFGILLFGHGSEDENIVYVRNEKIECEYEILRDPGHFGMEVLGLDEEIQHSRKPKKGKQHPKFRLE